MQKFVSRIVLNLFVGLAFLSAAHAQTENKIKIEKGKYQKVIVANFTVRDGVKEFPETAIPIIAAEIVDQLTKMGKFKEVSLEKQVKKVSEEESVSGEVTEEKTLGNAVEQENTENKPTDAANSETSIIRIVGEIIKYKKGNRAKRYFIGFGAGRSKVAAHIKFLDAAGNLLLEREVDGNVVIGLFGGNSAGATRGLAKEVAKVTKRTFF